MITSKESYDSVVSENKKLKNYIDKLRQQFSNYQQQQQAQYIQREGDYYTEKPKKYKKVIYEEDVDSEPELEENDYITEESEEEPEKIKQKKVTQKQKNNIFDYINNDVNRDKR